MANTHVLNKLSISTTAPTSAPANAAAYAALTYTLINGVGSLGEAGTSVNMLNYDTWSDTVVDKAKGMQDAGTPELELARIATDAGQIALRAAALTNLSYAFKQEANDKLTGGGTNTIIYNYGLVAGPRRPNGRNEDFDLEVFTLAFRALETVVAPT